MLLVLVVCVYEQLVVRLSVGVVLQCRMVLLVLKIVLLVNLEFMLGMYCMLEYDIDMFYVGENVYELSMVKCCCVVVSWQFVLMVDMVGWLLLLDSVEFVFQVLLFIVELFMCMKLVFILIGLLVQCVVKFQVELLFMLFGVLFMLQELLKVMLFSVGEVQIMELLMWQLVLSELILFGCVLQKLVSQLIGLYGVRIEKYVVYWWFSVMVFSLWLVRLMKVWWLNISFEIDCELVLLLKFFLSMNCVLLLLFRFLLFLKLKWLFDQMLLFCLMIEWLFDVELIEVWLF